MRRNHTNPLRSRIWGKIQPLVNPIQLLLLLLLLQLHRLRLGPQQHLRRPKRIGPTAPATGEERGPDPTLRVVEPECGVVGEFAEESSGHRGLEVLHPYNALDYHLLLRFFDEG